MFGGINGFPEWVWHQSDSGMARSRARAETDRVAQGQCRGRYRISWRVLRVLDSAKQRNRRQRVLVITAPVPGRFAGPADQIVSMTCTASQACFGKLRIGRKPPRGEVVQAQAVLEVPNGTVDPTVAAVAGLRFQRVPLPVGDEALIAIVGEERQLGAGGGLHPPGRSAALVRRRADSGSECIHSRSHRQGPPSNMELGARHPWGSSQSDRAGSGAGGRWCRSGPLSRSEGDDCLGVETTDGLHRELSCGAP